MRKSLAVGLVAAVVGSGCASSTPASSLPVYSSNQMGTLINEQKGEIVAVRQVLIQAPSRTSTSTGTGATLGAATVTGAILGSTGSVANAIGNVAGGAMGAKADDRVGEEITVRLDSGEMKIVVQEQTKEIFVPGQRIKLQVGSTNVRGSTRVISDDDPRQKSDVIGGRM